MNKIKDTFLLIDWEHCKYIIMLIHELDNKIKQILNDIQWSFPIIERPF